MSNNENLAAEAVASRVLHLAFGLIPAGEVTPLSILGADLGFDELDAVELIVEIESEFGVELDGQFEGDDPSSLLPLRLQHLIDATVKALAAKAQAKPVPAVQGEPVVDSARADDVPERQAAAAVDAACRAMVDRFLGWKLPADFHPDAGISFKPTELQKPGNPYWPTGTNLFHAGQALEMFKHCAIPEPTFVSVNLSPEERAELVELFRDSPPGRIELFVDPDAEKTAKLLALVRAFVAKHRIDCPEVIHQTDRVIEDAYGFIESLVDVAGYYRDPDEEAAA